MSRSPDKSETVSESPEPVEEKRGRGRPPAFSKEEMDVTDMVFMAGETHRTRQNFLYSVQALRVLNEYVEQMPELRRLGAGDEGHPDWKYRLRVLVQLGHMVKDGWAPEDVAEIGRQMAELIETGTTVASAEKIIRVIRQNPSIAFS